MISDTKKSQCTFSLTHKMISVHSYCSYQYCMDYYVIYYTCIVEYFTNKSSMIFIQSHIDLILCRVCVWWEGRWRDGDASQVNDLSR